MRVVVGLILRCVSALAQARKGVLRPVFGLREIFLFRFFFFHFALGLLRYDL